MEIVGNDNGATQGGDQTQEQGNTDNGGSQNDNGNGASQGNSIAPADGTEVKDPDSESNTSDNTLNPDVQAADPANVKSQEDNSGKSGEDKENAQLDEGKASELSDDQQNLVNLKSTSEQKEDQGGAGATKDPETDGDKGGDPNANAAGGYSQSEAAQNDGNNKTHISAEYTEVEAEKPDTDLVTVGKTAVFYPSVDDIEARQGGVTKVAAIIADVPDADSSKITLKIFQLTNTAPQLRANVPHKGDALPGQPYWDWPV